MTVSSAPARQGLGLRYLSVLASAVICYAALGAVLREVPGYVQHHLGGSALEVGLVVGAPSFTGAVLRPLGGRGADRFGPPRVLVAGAAVMAVGVLPAFATNMPALMASRLLIGAGEALMMSAAVLWLLTLAGPRRRGKALGHIGLANYAGLTIGPLLAESVSAGSAMNRLWVAVSVLPLLAMVLAAILPRPPAIAGEARVRSSRSSTREPGETGLWRQTLRPGMGLLLVNVGYVSILSFGPAATKANGLHIAGFIVPLFGAGVIASRTLLAHIPDRLGGARTLPIAAVAEGVALAAVGLASNLPLAIGGLVLLALGQGLAVPALGLLALGQIPADRQGAAAGAFFAYFDAGVSLGGPTIGAAAGVFDAPMALALAGAAVTASIPAALPVRRMFRAGHRSRQSLTAALRRPTSEGLGRFGSDPRRSA